MESHAVRTMRNLQRPLQPQPRDRAVRGGLRVSHGGKRVERDLRMGAGL